MPAIQLTDLSIRSLKLPKKGQMTYWDKRFSGFGVRVSQGGSKSFVLVHGPERHRTTIGKYDVLSLSDARKEAKRLLAERTLGKVALPVITYAGALDLFLADARQRNRPRTSSEYEWLLKRHFRFSKRRLDTLKPMDITREIGKLKNTPSLQNHAFVAARVFFRWAKRQGYLETYLLDGMSMPAPITSREHVLKPEELATVYQAASSFAFPYGSIVTLLILTGQRRGEIAKLQWEWINRDERTITLPADLTKNKCTHTFPYGDLAAAILDELPETEIYLFPAIRSHVRGKPTTTFNGWSKAKRDFDATLEDVDPFTLHDLRRTFSSTLAALGTPIHVTEKILNHTTGSLSGVAAIYNRHTYMDEMREAISKFERYVSDDANL